MHGKRVHMVVVPLSVLFNWALELRRFCPQLKDTQGKLRSQNPTAFADDLLLTRRGYNSMQM
jgi:SNF2 family DNA or RNA helicase